ncbi:tRNA pseudouridine(55) synthase TruB [Malaciobacter halophilus]|uniref:tRNA pseudouridine synthase B n=1 Tax=Malaciobacter halophilus TaxID=197482 RepID=A0A2N1J3U6_9BACT|nr:tRNA pseudouridine(55) synthase TruB [Malaciobacter halophilus]AXH08690.1 tRNA pseudouridine 55 synthase [Malaciobacter halophilus]PKI81216.1 tRNA pseudouridine(55) synthase TruB [Malaciobacter halophilus]
MQKRFYEKEPLNKLLVVNKPMYVSSNSYLNRIKRAYRNKKAGFSGTLDPFACGCLIVAFGQYTKLFKYFKKTPKTYKAVLWLGATSYSEDIENIIDIKDEKVLKYEQIEKVIQSLKKEIEYLPPKYCAKKINGKRAYELARAGEEVSLKKQTMKISNIKLISYMHPFITFEASVSEGSYIRSLGQIIAKELGVKGTLSYLQRLNEGKFFFDNQKELDPIEYLDLEVNTYTGTKKCLDDGKKISIEYLEKKDDGKYLILFEEFFSIIEISNMEVSYILNKVRR